MSAFGSSTNQKNAQGGIAEIGRWYKKQMEDGYGDAAAARLKGMGLTDQLIAGMTQLYQQGRGSPEEIRALGQQIMPGVDDYIAKSAGRIQSQIDAYNGLAPVQGDINDINAIQQEKNAQIGSNYGDIQGAIDQGFGSQRGRTSDVEKSIGADTADTFGKLGTNSDTAFGDARSAAGKGFGAISKNSGAAYDTVENRINQGRDFALGTTARAFAPAMAATLRRIRASGIDPNSPEAASLLQRVDAARGHAFDDSLQRTNSELNQNTIGRSQNQQGLDLSQLSNDQTLALQNAANKQGLSLKDYLARTSLAEQTRDIQNNLDAGNMSANITNADTAFQRGQQAYKEGQANIVNNRGLLVNDQQNQNALSDKANYNDLIGLNMQNQQFNAGSDFKNQDLGVRTGALQTLGHTGDTLFNQGTTREGEGQQAGQGALQGFGASYNIEAPNSSWATKALVGAGTAALGAFVPGFGGTNPFGKKPGSSGGGFGGGYDYGN